MVRQSSELLYFVEIIVDLVRGLAVPVGISIGEAQNTRAADVQPVTWMVLGMAAGKTLGDGLCGAHVVRRVGRVYMVA